VPDTSDFRRDYGSGQLDDSAVASTWREQFDLWFSEAAGLDQPQAVVLATADAAGRARARTVLIKSWDDDGFVWATNYDSRKGHDLAANPYAGLCFSWISLERQVQVEGPVERCSAAESDAIFAARPRGAQLAAWASPQSQALLFGQAELQQRLTATEARFDGADVPRPPHWGGYRLRPESVEFWQGRPNRLHDRIRFSPDPAAEIQGAWRRERLAP
jgi:pyridoxamine 5'-phosphate oxidase